MASYQIIDEYLADIPADKRAALEALRKTINDIVPLAEECISYSLPAFRLNGKVIVGFGASSKHCALYLFDGATVEAHADELSGYETSKGAIRFKPEAPLPDELVRKLVLEKAKKVSE